MYACDGNICSTFYGTPHKSCQYLCGLFYDTVISDHPVLKKEWLVNYKWFGKKGCGLNETLSWYLS
jgi:hypothetical protein